MVPCPCGFSLNFSSLIATRVCQGDFQSPAAWLPAEVDACDFPPRARRICRLVEVFVHKELTAGTCFLVIPICTVHTRVCLQNYIYVIGLWFIVCHFWLVFSLTIHLACATGLQEPVPLHTAMSCPVLYMRLIAFPISTHSWTARRKCWPNYMQLPWKEIWAHLRLLFLLQLWWASP